MTLLRYNGKSKAIEMETTFSEPEKSDLIWAHVTEANKSSLMEILKQQNVHPLALKLISTFHAFPRVDVFKNQAFISTFAILEDYSIVKINILIGKNYVITESESALELFAELEQEFQKHPEYMSHTGHILYHIFDKIQMFYLKVVDLIAEEILEVDRAVFIKPFSNEIGHRLHSWKKKLHELRQIVEDQDNVIKTISHSNFPYIDEDSGFYFQDILSNFSRVVNAFDIFKEEFVSIFDLQLSLKSDHMNVIMKTLTMVSVIFIPLSFIAGLYGMNFEIIPELKWKFGYGYALGLMAVISVSVILYFKKTGWWDTK